MMNFGNSKAKYSRALIEQATLSLLEEKEYGAASVTDICRRAGVSRAAFYRNFPDKDCVIRSIIRDSLARVPLEQQAGAPSLAYEVCRSFALQCMKERDLICLLYHRELFGLYEEEMYHYLRGMLPADDFYDFRAAQLSFGAMAVLIAWVRHECRENEDELAQIIDRLREIPLLSENAPPER